MSENVPAVRRLHEIPRLGNRVDDADNAKLRRRLGQILRQQRRSLEPPVSQKDVSLRLGIVQSAVSDWENGNSWPSALYLLAVMRYLDIDPAIILTALFDANGDDEQAA